MDKQNLERLRQYKIRRILSVGIEEQNHDRDRRVVLDTIERIAARLSWPVVVKLEASQAALLSLSFNSSPTIALVNAAQAARLSAARHSRNRAERARSLGLH